MLRLLKQFNNLTKLINNLWINLTNSLKIKKIICGTLVCGKLKYLLKMYVKF